MCVWGETERERERERETYVFALFGRFPEFPSHQLKPPTIVFQRPTTTRTDSGGELAKYSCLITVIEDLFIR